MPSTWLAATMTGGLCSGLAVPLLTARGLRQLGRPNLSTGFLLRIGVAVGAVAGAATTLASLRIGNAALAPALIVWGAALAAASCCDAVSQRIPTALVRQAIVVTSALLTGAFVLRGDWRSLVISLVAAVASGLVVLLCWRFIGAGFGDVRLAVLGGLGLGHVTHRGLLLGLAAFILIIATQGMVTLLRGGNRRTTIPFGPALTTGFLLAAAV